MKKINAEELEELKEKIEEEIKNFNFICIDYKTYSKGKQKEFASEIIYYPKLKIYEVCDGWVESLELLGYYTNKKSAYKAFRSSRRTGDEIAF